MPIHLLVYLNKNKSHQHSTSIAVILLYACLGFLILIIGIAAFIDIANSHDYIRTVNGTVNKVSDGDTIQVTTPEQTKLKVRLYGIDAQESYYKIEQPYGEKAKNALYDKVMGKHVKMDILAIDRYRRMVGIIWLDNRNVNLEMIREGHAEAYIEYLEEPYKKEFLDAEQEAKLAKKGIWSLPEYQRPADFRKALRIKDGK